MQRSTQPTTSATRALKVLRVSTIIARVVVAVALLVNVIFAFHVLTSRELVFAFALGIVVASLASIFVALF